MEKDTIWVVTGETVVTRGGGMKQLKVEELAVNVNLFIEQMGSSTLYKFGESIGHKTAYGVR